MLPVTEVDTVATEALKIGSESSDQVPGGGDRSPPETREVVRGRLQLHVEKIAGEMKSVQNLHSLNRSTLIQSIEEAREMEDHHTQGQKQQQAQEKQAREQAREQEQERERERERVRRQSRQKLTSNTTKRKFAKGLTSSLTRKISYRERVRRQSRQKLTSNTTKRKFAKGLTSSLTRKNIMSMLSMAEMKIAEENTPQHQQERGDTKRDVHNLRAELFIGGKSDYERDDNSQSGTASGSSAVGSVAKADMGKVERMILSAEQRMQDEIAASQKVLSSEIGDIKKQLDAVMRLLTAKAEAPAGNRAGNEVRSLFSQ
jgi:hypothetical protein